MTQPNFTTNQNAIPATDFDNLSTEELQKLINQAHQLKTGHMGRVHSTPPPPEKRHVDIDRLIERHGGQK